MPLTTWPLYNLAPEYGYPAQFGFKVLGTALPRSSRLSRSRAPNPTALRSAPRTSRRSIHRIHRHLLRHPLPSTARAPTRPLPLQPVDCSNAEPDLEHRGRQPRTRRAPSAPSASPTSPTPTGRPPPTRPRRSPAVRTWSSTPHSPSIRCSRAAAPFRPTSPPACASTSTSPRPTTRRPPTKPSSTPKPSRPRRPRTSPSSSPPASRSAPPRPTACRAAPTRPPTRQAIRFTTTTPTLCSAPTRRRSAPRQL